MQTKIMPLFRRRVIYLFMIKYIFLNQVVKCEDINSNQGRFLYQKMYSCPGTEKNVFCKYVIGKKMCDTTIGRICDKSCGFCSRGKKYIPKNH